MRSQLAHRTASPPSVRLASRPSPAPLPRAPRWGVRPSPTLLCILAATVLAACGGGHGTTPGTQESKAPLVECTSYVRELRACAAAVGAPTLAADTLTATLTRSDERARAQLESACARDRAHLHDSCK